MTRDELFPKVEFSSMSAIRIAGASLTVTQTQRMVDRAGYGLQSRVYGLTSKYTSQLSKAAILAATYRDEANYSESEESLRMVWAPGDFSDLHMIIQDTPSITKDGQT